MDRCCVYEPLNAPSERARLTVLVIFAPISTDPHSHVCRGTKQTRASSTNKTSMDCCRHPRATNGVDIGYAHHGAVPPDLAPLVVESDHDEETP
mmetsp:Transcript_79672/g.221704  ORF Transcript_79672/g.221704 Transcript_79672/m.221704 type:complete len:94 (+) Transcript_79672:559-840(+)